MDLKMFSGKWRPFIIDLNVLTYASTYPSIIFSSYIQYLQQHKHNASKLTQAKNRISTLYFKNKYS